VSEPREQICASCGHPSPSDARFCRECGAILTRPGAEAPRPTDSGTAMSPTGGDGREPAASAGPSWWWTAAIVALLLIAWFVQHRRRVDSAIPVPGVASPLPTPVVESTPAQPAPTAAPARHEPQGRAPGTAKEEEPTVRSTPEAEAEAGRPARHPGWYRMRFRAPLFREPSESSPVVTYLPEGTRIRVTRVLPGFLAVESVTGKAPGYVSSDDASPESRSIR